MDMQEIGYFLYMEEQEKRRHEEVNAELQALMVGELPTPDKEEK